MCGEKMITGKELLLMLGHFSWRSQSILMQSTFRFAAAGGRWSLASLRCASKTAPTGRDPMKKELVDLSQP